MDAEDYKAARKQLGLNQEQLAEKLGVTRKTITSRETGAPIGKEAQMAIKSLLVNTTIEARLKAVASDECSASRISE